MRDWTVLVTSAQADAQAAISDVQSRTLLKKLGNKDSWVQYPPASGRGHGFETRWWQSGDDAVSVAATATKGYLKAVEDIGLDVGIVLVHVASPEDRLSETTIGLEDRVKAADSDEQWNLMVRAIAGPGNHSSCATPSLDELLNQLPAPSSGFSRDGMVEVRFWIEGDDAAEAMERGTETFLNALATCGYPNWTIVCTLLISIEEGLRLEYRGMDQRIGRMDVAPISIRT